MKLILLLIALLPAPRAALHCENTGEDFHQSPSASLPDK